jgi:hypothetical protein
MSALPLRTILCDHIDLDGPCRTFLIEKIRKGDDKESYSQMRERGHTLGWRFVIGHQGHLIDLCPAHNPARAESAP